MLRKPEALFAAYATYKGDGERHYFRIAVITVMSAAISSFATDLSDTALPAMSLAVSVLAGFTFTALFSSGALSELNLPPPDNESDLADIKRLNKIYDNFRKRAKLFLLVAVFSLVLILLASIKIDWQELSAILSRKVTFLSLELLSSLREIHAICSKIVVFATFFIFFEMLHLFYRISESIYSALDIRRDYLSQRRR